MLKCRLCTLTFKGVSFWQELLWDINVKHLKMTLE